MYVYLDIETIPAQSPEVRSMVSETVSPPSRMSKPETIAAWERSDKPKAIEDAISKTSLDGTYGHVCCVGVAVGDGDPIAFSLRDGVAREGSVISQALRSINVDVMDAPLIIGHNVIEFDIRFLWQRAIVTGIKMPSWFPRDPKPWDGTVFDTMTAFAGYRGKIGMDRLCAVLGLSGKGEIDGSMIAGLWADGDHDRIAEYCKQDVARTREIHRCMIAAFGEDR